MSNKIELDKHSELLLKNDAFSNWLGVKIHELNKGHVKTSMLVRKEMLNPHGICHGGILFSFADSTMAYAAHTHGGLAVSIEANISFCNKIAPNKTIFATTKEIKNGKSIATYEITICDEEKTTLAVFRGTMFRMESKQ